MQSSNTISVSEKHWLSETINSNTANTPARKQFITKFTPRIIIIIVRRYISFTKLNNICIKYDLHRQCKMSTGNQLIHKMYSN